jgi:hypothetical protein
VLLVTSPLRQEGLPGLRGIGSRGPGKESPEELSVTILGFEVQVKTIVDVRKLC